ncbi:hypothetical protein RFI_25758 [Reticulomyxa filosa]|uniref:Uncharacterized protein n=1 Tax=Reticulomyxa filosa TaxID=46433 RepID=X6MCL0_RETFI|nr:hypothetical protein RFI_25758 [Reticulomyxa filosa]|eukprot:ETO11619.1 hypothetical protein RFI_25758 [Reticulomyxa filosa]
MYEAKQTFSMKYKSIWKMKEEDIQSDSKIDNQPFNTWIKHNQDTKIGKLEDGLKGVRGSIGGINNDLLCITYFPGNIEVIDLKTMKPLNGIKGNIIPKGIETYGITYHCFMPLTINNKKVINQFILFYRNIGLLIKYDDKTNHLNFTSYSFVYIFNYLFLIGGLNGNTKEKTKLVYKLSIIEKKWTGCRVNLPIESNGYFAILGNDMNVYLFGKSTKVKSIFMSIHVEKIFEKIEFLEMANLYENYITKLKLEIPFELNARE